MGCVNSSKYLHTICSFVECNCRLSRKDTTNLDVSRNRLDCARPGPESEAEAEAGVELRSETDTSVFALLWRKDLIASLMTALLLLLVLLLLLLSTLAPTLIDLAVFPTSSAVLLACIFTKCVLTDASTRGKSASSKVTVSRDFVDRNRRPASASIRLGSGTTNGSPCP